MQALPMPLSVALLFILGSAATSSLTIEESAARYMCLSTTYTLLLILQRNELNGTKETRSYSLAHKSKEVCAGDAWVGKVVLLALSKHFCQCIIQFVFLFIMPCRGDTAEDAIRLCAMQPYNVQTSVIIVV